MIWNFGVYSSTTGGPACRSVRAIVGAAVIALLLGGPTAAGPLEDAVEAYQRGDFVTAAGLSRQLAKQGDSDAQFLLGMMYDEGKGVPQDHAEAAKWFRKSAEQGDSSAQLLLGVKYASGEGVPKDLVRAHMWSSLATAAGYKNAAKVRNSVAKQMTPAQIAEAEKLAREWKPK